MKPRLLNEKQVLKKLDIPDFRHLSKDKVMEFVSMIPEMDPEVAKAAISQFPEVVNLTLGLVNDQREIAFKAIDSASDADKAVLAAYKTIINSLSKILEDGKVTPDEYDKVIDRMIQVAKLMEGVEEKHRKFLKDVIMNATAMVGFVAVVAVTALGGGKVQINPTELLEKIKK